MIVKNLKLTEEAHKALYNEKLYGESYSDTVLRLITYANLYMEKSDNPVITLVKEDKELTQKLRGKI